jgi:hypothetical protein
MMQSSVTKESRGIPRFTRHNQRIRLLRRFTSRNDSGTAKIIENSF